MDKVFTINRHLGPRCEYGRVTLHIEKSNNPSITINEFINRNASYGQISDKEFKVYSAAFELSLNKDLKYNIRYTLEACPIDSSISVFRRLGTEVNTFLQGLK